MQKLRMRKRMNLLTTMKRLFDFNFRDRETLKVTIRVLDVEKIFKNNDGIAEKTEELFKNRVENTIIMVGVLPLEKVECKDEKKENTFKNTEEIPKKVI